MFNISTLTNRSGCHVTFEEGEFTFTVNVKAKPTVTISEVPEIICEGETVDIELSFTGTAPFTIEAVGIGNIVAESESYTLSFAPPTSISAHFIKLTDAEGCETQLDQTISLVVTPSVSKPEISGDAELDVRLTPTTTYTIGNNVEVAFSVTPEDAGSLVPANDGKSVVVTWSDTFKGDAVLTASPIAECNNGESTLTIGVTNTTDINELGTKANVFPNPTKGNVTVEVEGLKRLTVLNELGQVVYDEEPSNNSETLNMTQFGTGVFLIRIHTENGVGFKRVTVVK